MSHLKHVICLSHFLLVHIEALLGTLLESYHANCIFGHFSSSVKLLIRTTHMSSLVCSVIIKEKRINHIYGLNHHSLLQGENCTGRDQTICHKMAAEGSSPDIAQNHTSALPTDFIFCLIEKLSCKLYDQLWFISQFPINRTISLLVKLLKQVTS